MSRPRSWLALRPGVPVTVVGAGYVVLGLVYVSGRSRLYPIDWFVFGLYELLATAVVYAGFRLSDQQRSLGDALRVFGATIGFGLIGALVAGALVALQLRRGVQLEGVWFLLAAASATTAAIGVGLALYYIDLQAERARLTGQAETVSELNKQLTVLHRVLRHNLRNELTVIKGTADLLLDREPAPEVAEPLQTLLEHAENVESLSENAYRLRQVWAQDARVEQEVTELVERCVRELEADHPEVSVTTDLPAHAAVRAHPRLKSAVDEALENAVVHNDSTSIDVVIDVSRTTSADPSVEISIADTGTGIPAFEPAVLEQVEESPLQHATGLGLWLIYWVIERSGGRIRFEANDPQGTIVRMRLPAVVD